jgi:hypothetical protein
MDKYVIIQSKKEKEKQITEPIVSLSDPQLEVKEIKESKEKKKDKYVLCNPSEEQSQIIQCVLNGKNVIVDSVAGSGKTTTILHIGKSMPEKRILVLTYNAKLKIETREKAESLELTNMEIHSYHAFCVKYYDHRCHTDPGIITVLKGDKKPKKSFGYDLILLDEQQDMTNLYYRLVKKIIRDSGSKDIQIACFGDIYQNIYSFKGSDDRFLSFADKIYNSNNEGLAVRQWQHLRISESFRITKNMCSFVNKHLLGNTRIISKKESPHKVRYIICDTFTQTPYDEFRRYIELGYRPDDIFILAPSVKKGKHDSPVRILENRIVNSGIRCYVPISDEEKIDEQIIQNKVVFSTFHQVKGLERKVVLVFNFDDSYFDFYGRDLPKDRCPNIMYVALTRAKEQMTLFHHYENEYISCLLDKYRIGSTCTLIERRECLGIKKTLHEPLELGVTELIRNMGIEIIDYAIHSIDYKVIQAAEKAIDVPLKIQTGANTFENVSDINGVAIPAIYEYLSHKKVTMIDQLRKLISRLSLYHRQQYDTIVNKNKMTVSDILYLANLYSSIVSGYIFKTEQIKEYKWLASNPLKSCLERLGHVVSRDGTTYEVNVEAKEVIYNRRLVGIVDVIDNINNIVYELKCVQTVTSENILQLAIYAWIIEGLDKSPSRTEGVGSDGSTSSGATSLSGPNREAKVSDPKDRTQTGVTYPKDRTQAGVTYPKDRTQTGVTYRLFNIFTNEVIELIYNEKIKGMVEFLVKAKYGSLERCSDEEFIKKCLETEDVVLEPLEKCLL